LLIQLFPASGSESQHMADRVPYYQELAQRLQAIPGVESVSYSHMGPILGYEFTQRTSVPSLHTPPTQAVFEAVGPRFFHLAKMRLLAGREFDWRDNETSRPVVIVSESLARRLFPNQNAIGQTIDFGERKNLEIVGVVNSASLWLPQSREPQAVYLALMQIPTYNSSSIDIRTTGDPAATLPAARSVIESLGRHFVMRAQNLDQRSDIFLLTDRMIATLSSFFGGLALLLTSIGVYGLTSYAVTRRVSEIGLRMALGALPASVLALVMREVVWLVILGAAVGIPAALVTSRLISSMVYGVAGNDALTILLSSSLLLATAGVAGYLPARRASRVNPITALRSE
jgi:predicted permease